MNDHPPTTAGDTATPRESATRALRGELCAYCENSITLSSKFYNLTKVNDLEFIGHIKNHLGTKAHEKSDRVCKKHYDLNLKRDRQQKNQPLSQQDTTHNHKPAINIARSLAQVTGDSINHYNGYPNWKTNLHHPHYHPNNYTHNYPTNGKDSSSNSGSTPYSLPPLVSSQESWKAHTFTRSPSYTTTTNTTHTIATITTSATAPSTNTNVTTTTTSTSITTLVAPAAFSFGRVLSRTQKRKLADSQGIPAEDRDQAEAHDIKKEPEVYRKLQQQEEDEIDIEDMKKHNNHYYNNHYNNNIYNNIKEKIFTSPPQPMEQEEEQAEQQNQPEDKLSEIIVDTVSQPVSLSPSKNNGNDINNINNIVYNNTNTHITKTTPTTIIVSTTTRELLDGEQFYDNITSNIATTTSAATIRNGIHDSEVEILSNFKKRNIHLTNSLNGSENGGTPSKRQKLNHQEQPFSQQSLRYSQQSQQLSGNYQIAPISNNWFHNPPQQPQSPSQPPQSPSQSPQSHLLQQQSQSPSQPPQSPSQSPQSHLLQQQSQQQSPQQSPQQSQQLSPQQSHQQSQQSSQKQKQIQVKQPQAHLPQMQTQLQTRSHLLSQQLNEDMVVSIRGALYTHTDSLLSLHGIPVEERRNLIEVSDSFLDIISCVHHLSNGSYELIKERIEEINKAQPIVLAARSLISSFIQKNQQQGRQQSQQHQQQQNTPEELDSLFLQWVKQSQQ